MAWALALCASLVAGCSNSDTTAQAAQPTQPANPEAAAFIPSQTLVGSIIHWTIDGIAQSREWILQGRLSLQSLSPGSTAIDMWPTTQARPHVDSLSELTLQRYQWDNPAMERFNISAMVDETDGGAYRFGVERAGTGIHRPILFCFEDLPHASGQSFCPFKITTEGVFFLSGGVYKQLQ